MHIDQAITSFLDEHKLPASYAELIQRWYLPMCDNIALHHKEAKRPILVGINGCQGSGKSTLAAIMALLLSNTHKLKATTVSLDDFYLTRKERNQLSKNVHPLLKTRGVPGTHNIELAKNTLDSLLRFQGKTKVPMFNKATDDRQPPELWKSIDSQQDVIILEGWCLGVSAESPSELKSPINSLEEHEDKEGHWRQYVNEQIANQYQNLYDKIDILIMLKAPSFTVVYEWRLEQEQKLKATQEETAGGIMDADQVLNFVQFFQRLTERSLKQLPSTTHFLFQLNEDRQVTAMEQPRTIEL